MEIVNRLRRFFSLSSSFLFLLGTCTPVTRLNAQAIQGDRAILERLDQLEQQNRELLEQIKALREMVAAKNNNPEAAGQEGQEQGEVSQRRIEELAQTKVEASQKFPIHLTGTLLMNAFWNGAFAGVQNPTVAALNPSTAPIGATFRQTVLGLTFHGPQTLFGGSVSGSVYMDFFAGSDQTLNHLLRLRLATIQVDWPNTTFAVGQDKPLVSRREPNSLAQIGVSPLTGAGNPWLWAPQARLEQRFRVSARDRVTAEAGIYQTSESAYQAPGARVLHLSASRPAFETRLAFHHESDENHLWEIAPVLHVSSSHANGYSVPSRLYGVDWLFKPVRQFEVTGLAFRGENFANLGALAGITVSGEGDAKAVRGSGGWLQARYFATAKLTLGFYGGLEDDINRDLLPGRIGKNQYLAGNATYLLAPNVIAAFEVGRNRTTYIGQGNRFNTHYDLALGYLF